VDGIAYDSDKLKDVIKAAKGNATPIALLIKTGDAYITAQIDYHDGLRYPRLERVNDAPDRLSEILRMK
jgi:hypothetical protein